MSLHHRLRYPWAEMFKKPGDIEIFPEKTAHQIYPVFRNFILKTFGNEAITVVKNTPQGAIAALLYVPGFDMSHCTYRSPVNSQEDDEEDISEYEGIADE